MRYDIMRNVPAILMAAACPFEWSVMRVENSMVTKASDMIENIASPMRNTSERLIDLFINLSGWPCDYCKGLDT